MQLGNLVTKMNSFYGILIISFRTNLFESNVVLNFKARSYNYIRKITDIISYFILNLIYLLFQMCHLHGRICHRRSHSLSALHAYVPHGMHRRLAHEKLHLPQLHGASGCGLVGHLRDSLVTTSSAASSSSKEETW